MPHRFGVSVVAIFVLSSFETASAQFRAYVSTSTGVSVIDVATETVVSTREIGDSRGIALSPDGALLYVGSASVHDDFLVSVFETETNELVTRISVVGPTTKLAVTPDGAFAYATTKKYCMSVDDCVGMKAVVVIDTLSMEVTTAIPLGDERFGALTGLAITPDGSSVYVVVDGGSVRVISTATQAVESSVVLPCCIGPIAMAPDGTSAYVGGSEFEAGDLQEFAIPDHRSIGSIGYRNFFPAAIAWDPQKPVVYAAGSVSCESGGCGGKVSIVDSNTRRVTGTVSLDEEPRAVAVSPNGASLYVASRSSQEVLLIDTTTQIVRRIITLGALAREIVIGRAPVDGAGVSGDDGCAIARIGTGQTGASEWLWLCVPLVLGLCAKRWSKPAGR